MTYTKALQIAWKLAPWLLLAIVALLWWMAPSAGSNAAPGQTVTLVAEEALTKPARKWKKRRNTCQPEAGGKAFPLTTREVPADDAARLAAQYGALFANETPPLAPVGDGNKKTKNEPASVPIVASFGEYHTPELPYGATMFAGVGADGEPQFIFDAKPSPKFAWKWAWGGGAFYDLTSGTTGENLDPTRHSRVYGFVEPFQTKDAHWRIEGGALEVAEDWEPYIGVGAEIRIEPRLRKNRHGLKALKLPN